MWPYSASKVTPTGCDLARWRCANGANFANVSGLWGDYRRYVDKDTLDNMADKLSVWLGRFVALGETRV